MNLRLRVTAAAERQVRAGHPWVFAASVREGNRAGHTGELAILYDRHDRFLAAGLYDAHSPIAVRILHCGKPAMIDAAWWRRRAAEAIGRRRMLLDAQTTGYRLINGESDGWPGLVLDRYDDTLVLKLYTAAWLPRLDELVSLLATGRRMVLRLSRNIQSEARRQIGKSDGEVVQGPPLDGPVIFLENALRFEADVQRGQKTGFFLDQRENRLRVRSLAGGRAVLNLFSYTGGFSLNAAAGGATRVMSVDVSEPALEGARRNFALNPSLATSLHETLRADVFSWMREPPSQRFDMVVLDPPSLAKKESERADAVAAYGKLIASAALRLNPEGILVAASCSAHVPAEEFFGVACDVFLRGGRRWEELGVTLHAPDHPASFAEAQYLKCVYIRVK